LLVAVAAADLDGRVAARGVTGGIETASAMRGKSRRRG
jgi:hypothetical protein